MHSVPLLPCRRLQLEEGAPSSRPSLGGGPGWWRWACWARWRQPSSAAQRAAAAADSMSPAGRCCFSTWAMRTIRTLSGPRPAPCPGATLVTRERQTQARGRGTKPAGSVHVPLLWPAQARCARLACGRRRFANRHPAHEAGAPALACAAADEPLRLPARRPASDLQHSRRAGRLPGARQRAQRGCTAGASRGHAQHGERAVLSGTVRSQAVRRHHLGRCGCGAGRAVLLCTHQASMRQAAVPAAP